MSSPAPYKMSGRRSDADLRAKVLSLLEEFRGHFTSKQLRKAYKKKHESHLEIGMRSTNDFLKTFPELSFDEEKDSFILKSKKIKFEEGSSSSGEEEDKEIEEEPGEKKEINETRRMSGGQRNEGIYVLPDSYADPSIRARILKVAGSFSRPFTYKRFHKVYRNQFNENLQLNGIKNIDYLKLLPELTHSEGKFIYNSDEMDGNWRDCGDEMEQGDKSTKIREDWNDEQEYQKVVASIKKELEYNPDPTVGEEDIKIFAKRHLIRRIVIEIINDVKRASRDGPFFTLTGFCAEWKRCYQEAEVDFSELGYLGLCAFLKSFPWLLYHGMGRYGIKIDLGDSSPSSPTTILVEEKEASRLLNESRTQLEVEDENDLRQKVLAVAMKVSKYDEAYKRLFFVDDFSLEWKNTYGQHYVPCTQFGFEKIRHYFDAIPNLQRINKRKYAIRSDSDYSIPERNEGKKDILEKKTQNSEAVTRTVSTEPPIAKKNTEKRNTVNAIRSEESESESDSDNSSSDDEEPSAVTPKKELSEAKKIDSRELPDRMKACEEVVMKKRGEKAAIPGKQDILRKGRDSSSVSTEHPMAKKQTEKRKTGKRSNSPDVILLDEEERKKKKIPKLEIQESLETMRQEGERATVRGETQGDRGEETRSSKEGLQLEGRAPGNPPMDSSDECMGPASGPLMSGGPKKIKKEELKRTSETAARKRPLAVDSDHIHDKFRIHSGERPFECSQCGKKFARKKGLKQHRISDNACPRDSGEDCRQNQTPNGYVDSGSGGDRLEAIQVSKSDKVDNNGDSEEEGVEVAMEEEVPKILSPEIRDVFHIFANMLDIKSFVKMVMTCKDMYKQCVEDKNIKISVNEGTVRVATNENDGRIWLMTHTVPERHAVKFLGALRKFPCRTRVRNVTFEYCGEVDYSITEATTRFLKDIGVESIDFIVFAEKFVEFEEIIPFLKNFDVFGIIFKISVPPEILENMLDLNIEHLSHEQEHPLDEIPVDVLLENSSKIPEISLKPIQYIHKDAFMRLLSKIQEGSLLRVAVSRYAVDWSEFDSLPYDHDGPLPEERPLLLARTTRRSNEMDEYWFLHWNGDVTKCVAGEDELEIFKCEPWEYPWILRGEMDILDALMENCPRVSCNAGHYKDLMASFEDFHVPVDPALPLPKERPLFFPITNHFFWLLTEDDSLLYCEWKNGCATWDRFRSFGHKVDRIGHPALAKYMFWKVLEDDTKYRKTFFCDDVDEFHSWFDDFEKLDFGYLSELPPTRPLVFEKTSSEERMLRVVLFEEHAVQCRLVFPEVYIERCYPWNLPSILITASAIKKILQETLHATAESWRGEERMARKVRKYIDYEVFCDGFDEFKKSLDRSSLPLLLCEKKKTNNDGELVDTRFYCSDDDIGLIRWKNGRFLLCSGDMSHFPVGFMKQLFRRFAERTRGGVDPLILKYEKYIDCLEQFIVVPYDFRGSLKSNSPLAFVKNECANCSTRSSPCNCTDFHVHVWFLWDGLKTTYSSWKQGEVLFSSSIYYSNMPPPILTTRDYLQNLLQEIFDETTTYNWYGHVDVFRDLLDKNKKLHFDYDGPLPKERPLVVRADSLREDDCFLLREDGTVIKCEVRNSGRDRTRATFSLPSRYDYLPPVIKSLPDVEFKD